MLRAFDEIISSAASDRILASEHGRAIVHGGGGQPYRAPWHWHDCVMILLPHRGALDLKHEAHRSGWWLSEDRFALVPKSRWHETASIRDSHAHIAMYLSDGGIARLENELGSLDVLRRARLPCLFGITPQMRALQQICIAAGAAGKRAETLRRHLASALLLQCIEQVERTAPLSAASRRGYGDVVFSEMQAFVKRHAANALSLDDVAETFGLSRRHATRLFRDKTGQSIAEFQERERLALADQLLAVTDLSIGEIAFRVGYESGSALARAMRRVTGQSPSALRRSKARSDG